MSVPLKSKDPASTSRPAPSVHLPRTAMQWVVFLLAAALLAAIVCLIVWKTASADSSEAAMEQTVVTCGDDFRLSNTELNYYFWSEYFYLVDQPEALPDGLDTTKPLDQQTYDEDETWQDVLLDQALSTVQSTMSLAFAAREAGFELPEREQSSLGQVLATFEGYASAAGFTDESGEADLEAYLADSYGSGATLESFLQYLENSYLAKAYADQLRDEPTFTDQEISDYYDSFAEDYEAQGVAKDETYLRNIRLILIAPASDDEAAWEEARASARTLLDTWLAESGTEADFADLAQSRSAHGSAADGGLIEDLRPADLSETLAAWIFDEARQSGDTEVLKMDAGWAAVYYVGTSDRTVWQKTAEADLRDETYQNAFLEILSRYEFQVNREAIVIQAPKGLYDTEGAES